MRFKFLIFGILFGLCFPLVATVIELYGLPGEFSFSRALQLHGENPLLLIIDTAPFFLALFSYGIGRVSERYAEAQAVREAESQTYIRKLEQQNKELNSLNRTMDSLVYTASHDLKAPLNNFRSMTSMLRDFAARPGSEVMMEKIMDKMDQAGAKMSQTITDLLDISRMKAEMQETHEKVQLKPLFASLLEDQEQVIAAREAKVELAVMEEVEVEFSRRSLESLFGNLISNSLKYSSPNRKPEISITAQRSPEKVVVKVADNGQGIDLEKHGTQLFKMFKRFHPSAGVEGTGVGLFIVNQIVEKAGGSIEIESSVDVGTTFTIEFPAMAA